MRRLTAHGKRLAALSAVSCQLLAVAACSHAAAPAPAPALPPPVMEPASPPPPTGMVAPAAAAGTWRLRTEIQSGNTPPPRNRSTPAASIVLSARPATTPAMGAPPETQLNATINMPGYSTRPTRRRTGQAASWWPIPGDSVVVQFAQGTRGQIQLRGILHGNAMQGEIWYLSVENGATFQMGSWSASRLR